MLPCIRVNKDFHNNNNSCVAHSHTPTGPVLRGPHN